MDNPFWNGLSTFSHQSNVEPLTSISNLPADDEETALVLVPYVPFTQLELSQIDSYVSQGGTLLLMDDYGFGNQVLGSLGLNLRFSGQALLDPLFNYKNKWLPEITDFASSPLTANISSIMFNHATTLNDTSGVTVLAYSSSFSFLDLNGNGEADSNEPYGPFPVAAYTKVGQGYVVAVADPSIAINSMVNMGNNLAFINNLESLSGANLRVYVDQSHLPQTPLDSAKAVLEDVYRVVASPLGTLSLIVVALALSFKRFWKRQEKP